MGGAEGVLCSSRARVDAYRSVYPYGIETRYRYFYRAAGGAVSDQVPHMRQQSVLDKKPDVDFQYRRSSPALVTCRNSLQLICEGNQEERS
jgi:hypothetical protein